MQAIKKLVRLLLARRRAYSIYTRTVHCCIKCPQNLQVKTLLQMYTAFTSRIYMKYFFKVFDPIDRGNLLLKILFLVL